MTFSFAKRKKRKKRRKKKIKKESSLMTSSLKQQRLALNAGSIYIRAYMLYTIGGKAGRKEPLGGSGR
jgi:hypothetical protein